LNAIFDNQKPSKNEKHLLGFYGQIREEKSQVMVGFDHNPWLFIVD